MRGSGIWHALRRAVTPRGRTLLAAGAAAMVAAQSLGQRDLVRIGALLIALPLVSLAVVARTRYRLRLVRSLAPMQVQVGEPARVVLRLENVSRLPSTTLLMEDTLPYALGGRPRFVLRRVESGGVREAAYDVRCDIRGRYRLGPLTVRVGDPFGCAEVTRSFSSTDKLVVTPVVYPLPPVRLGGDWQGGTDGRSAQVAVTGEADIATREYRRGDDLRRVHWRSTAKAGVLMVRRDEQPQQNRATVLLDTRRSAHRGDGPGASFEWAVSAAASIGVHLTRRGYRLRLVTTDGVHVGASTPSAAESALLESLAVVAPGTQSRLGGGLARLSGAGGGLVVAVLGALDTTDVEELAAVPTIATVAVAVCIDTASWATLSPKGRVEADHELRSRRAALASAGWRTVVARHGESLAVRWPDAGRRSAPDWAAAPPPEPPPKVAPRGRVAGGRR